MKPNKSELPKEKASPSKAKESHGEPRRAKRRQHSAVTESSSEENKRYGLDESAAFEVSHTEGNTLRGTGQYRKAINSYSKVCINYKNINSITLIYYCNV